MPLEFIDHRRKSANEYSWMPSFDRSGTCEKRTLFDEPKHYSVSKPSFVQVLEHRCRVARVEFDDPGGKPEGRGRAETPLGAPADPVHRGRRRRDSSRNQHPLVKGLADLHHWCRLFAYNGEPDAFWAPLGWQRFDQQRRNMFSSSPGADWRRSGCSWGPFA